MMAMFGFLELFLVLPLIAIGLLGTVFWIWMLIDAALNEPEGSDKIVWVLIILFTHFLGALIYFFARRANRPPRSAY